MATTHKRTLREIAASGSTALRHKVADLVLVDLLRGRRVDCIQTLRKAAVSVSVSYSDEEEVRGAKDILAEVGTRDYRADSMKSLASMSDLARKNLLALSLEELASSCEATRLSRMMAEATARACCSGESPGSWFRPMKDGDTILKASMLITKDMKEELAQLAMIGHIIVGGGKRLLRATAVTSIAKGHSEEKAFELLDLLDCTDHARTLDRLAEIGVLTDGDVSRFLERCESRAKQVPVSVILSENGHGRYVQVRIGSLRYVLNGKDDDIHRWNTLSADVLLQVVRALRGAGAARHMGDLSRLDPGLARFLRMRFGDGKVMLETGLGPAPEEKRPQRPPKPLGGFCSLSAQVEDALENDGSLRRMALRVYLDLLDSGAVGRSQGRAPPVPWMKLRPLDILVAAQRTVDKLDLSASALAGREPELHEALQSVEWHGKRLLEYVDLKGNAEPAAVKQGGKAPAPQQKRPAHATDYSIRPLRTASVDEDYMYRAIMVDCFALGAVCGTEEEVHSKILDRIGGNQGNLALFRKCWAHLAYAGAIKSKGPIFYLNADPASIKDKKIKGIVRWSALVPLPAGMSSEEMRKVGIHGRKLSRPNMYRLICIECFRLGTNKPLIKQGYCDTNLVQSNMRKRLYGDTNLTRLFNRCWGKMASSNAILGKKAHEGVSSINPHIEEITDPLVRDAVEWALSEQRRVQNGSSV